MFIIGLTGGLATGKSTVAQMLVDCGAHLVDADKIARACLEPGTDEFQMVVRTFGLDILEKGRIHRSKLADIVFNDPSRLKQLEEIIHPFVRRETKRLFSEIGLKNKDAVIVWDVPLLFEKNLEKETDVTIVVAAKEDQQIERAMTRLNISRDDALRRIRRQMPIIDKIQRADFVIRNDGSLEDTRKKVAIIWKQLTKQKKS